MTGSASPGRMGRRRFLAMTVGLGLVACSGTPASSPPPTVGASGRPTRRASVPPRTAPPSPSPNGSSSPSPTPSTAPPPAPAPFEPLAEDMLPNAKRLASRVAQALTTYDPGATPVAVAGTAVSPDLAEPAAGALAEPDELAAVIAPLVRPDVWSRGEVIYPQLGGETFDACAVMVVTRQTMAVGDEAPLVTTRALDVRLRLVEENWALESVASIGGMPLEPAPDLSPAARAVLEDPRIDLPDSARWDIHEGLIDERLLATMVEMADIAPYSVTVLRSGHPPNVFGMKHTSNHMVGRAVDVWQVDGMPVVVQQPDPTTPAHVLLRTLFDRGQVSELGGPWAFDGYGGRSFTDAHVHKDHLHIAFS